MDLPALIKQSKGTKLPQELFVAANSYVDKMKLCNQYTMLLVYSCWYKPFCPYLVYLNPKNSQHMWFAGFRQKRWRTIKLPIPFNLTSEICRPIDFVKLWRQGPQPLKIYTLRDNSSKSLVSRLQAYPKNFSWNNINSKSSGGEVASISKQALVEPYESKSHKSFLKNRWWRGGGPIQTDSLW